MRDSVAGLRFKGGVLTLCECAASPRALVLVSSHFCGKVNRGKPTQVVVSPAICPETLIAQNAPCHNDLPTMLLAVLAGVCFLLVLSHVLKK